MQTPTKGRPEEAPKKIWSRSGLHHFHIEKILYIEYSDRFPIGGNDRKFIYFFFAQEMKGFFGKMIRGNRYRFPGHDIFNRLGEGLRPILEHAPEISIREEAGQLSVGIRYGDRPRPCGRDMSDRFQNGGLF